MVELHEVLLCGLLQVGCGRGISVTLRWYSFIFGRKHQILDCPCHSSYALLQQHLWISEVIQNWRVLTCCNCSEVASPDAVQYYYSKCHFHLVEWSWWLESKLSQNFSCAATV